MGTVSCSWRGCGPLDLGSDGVQGGGGVWGGGNLNQVTRVIDNLRGHVVNKKLTGGGGGRPRRRVGVSIS